MINSKYFDFDKIAANLAELRTMSNALKPNILRAGISGSGITSGLRRNEPGLLTISQEILNDKHILRSNERFKHYRMPQKQFKFFGLNKPTILMGRGGGIGAIKGVVGDELRGKIRALDPKNKEALNRIFMLHEGAEASVKGDNVTQVYGHLSPEVLLREHNLTASLPNELSGARDVLKHLRTKTTGLHEGSLLNQAGINYGEGRTLSDKTIKHMTQRYNKAIDAANIRELDSNLPNPFPNKGDLMSRIFDRINKRT